MKQYAFYSDLTPEQLRSRLVARTRPMKMGWMYEEHRVFARLLPDGGFYLAKTGGVWQFRPLLPFAASVSAEGTGCRIQGGFRPTREMKRFLMGFMGVAFLIGLAVTGVSAFALVCLAAVVGLWGGLVWLLMRNLSSRRSREETLTFIEENLLRQ